MPFNIAVTLKFTEQFHVIRNTIFHMKLKHMKCLASETCDNSILHAKDFERWEIFTKSDTVSYSFVYREIIFWGFVKIPYLGVICRALLMQKNAKNKNVMLIFISSITTFKKKICGSSLNVRDSLYKV